MVGKVADHEYLLVVQCAGVGVDLFIVGQQQGVVTVDEGLVRLAQRQQAAVEAVHRVRVAHLFGAADVGGVGDRYTCMIQGKERELWFEDGRWFAAAKVVNEKTH